mgnify:CR=1 FL=1
MSNVATKAKKPNLSVKSVLNWILDHAMIIVIVLLALYVQTQRDAFLKPASLINIISLTAARLPMALGVAGCIILAGTDLTGQIHFIIICLCSFALVSKPAGTFVFIEFRFVYHRHDGELSVVVYPRTGLVSLLESADLRSCVLIHPAVAHLTCLRAPEVHTPRTRDGRIRVTR